jgi:hypothetical protein
MSNHEFACVSLSVRSSEYCKYPCCMRVYNKHTISIYFECYKQYLYCFGLSATSVIMVISGRLLF